MAWILIVLYSIPTGGVQSIRPVSRIDCARWKKPSHSH
jgi:hypothetical protein